MVGLLNCHSLASEAATKGSIILAFELIWWHTPNEVKPGNVSSGFAIDSSRLGDGWFATVEHSSSEIIFDLASTRCVVLVQGKAFLVVENALIVFGDPVDDTVYLTKAIPEGLSRVWRVVLTASCEIQVLHP